MSDENFSGSVGVDGHLRIGPHGRDIRLEADPTGTTLLVNSAAVGAGTSITPTTFGAPVWTGTQYTSQQVVVAPTAVKTGPYTAVVGDYVPVDATSGALTVTLPAAPPDRTRLTIKKVDVTGNAVTIAASSTDVFNTATGPTSITLLFQNEDVSLQYASATGIWYATFVDWKALLFTPRPETDPLFPTFIANAKSASFPRNLATNNCSSLSTGRLTLTLCPVWPGLVISKITFISAVTNAGTPTAQWFNLVSTDGNRTLLAITSDDGAGVWNASSPKTLTLASPYTIPAGVYSIYAGCMVAATTVPTLSGLNGTNNAAVGATNATPLLVANSSTGLSTPGTCPNPVGALTAATNAVYVVFS